MESQEDKATYFGEDVSCVRTLKTMYDMDSICVVMKDGKVFRMQTNEIAKLFNAPGNVKMSITKKRIHRYLKVVIWEDEK
jgi:uncharacterized protein (UPF0216 family)